MTKIEQFFYDHAGFSWNPATETQEQGRERYAKALAAAEHLALEENWHYDWDWDNYDCGHAKGECSGRPEYCQLWDAERASLLASLSGICDADDNYRRVVQAELAVEAMTRLEASV